MREQSKLRIREQSKDKDLTEAFEKKRKQHELEKQEKTLEKNLI